MYNVIGYAPHTFMTGIQSHCIHIKHVQVMDTQSQSTFTIYTTMAVSIWLDKKDENVKVARYYMPHFDMSTLYIVQYVYVAYFMYKTS
jgi:hypothetical protein